MLAVVCVMMSLIYNNYDPARALCVDNRQFNAYDTISWQRYHMKSSNDISLFPDTVLILSALLLWTNVPALVGVCTWRCGTGFL